MLDFVSNILPYLIRSMRRDLSPLTPRGQGSPRGYSRDVTLFIHSTWNSWMLSVWSALLLHSFFPLSRLLHGLAACRSSEVNRGNKSMYFWELRYAYRVIYRFVVWKFLVIPLYHWVIMFPVTDYFHLIKCLLKAKEPNKTTKKHDYFSQDLFLVWAFFSIRKLKGPPKKYFFSKKDILHLLNIDI